MTPPSPPSITAVAAITAVTIIFRAASATWCRIRSEASEQALQKTLDYVCWAGADCEPIKSSGLCFLPNTFQANASYDFNSYYQRKATTPGSCEFSGTANVAKTDPSYGSCVYPSTSSTAGGILPPTTGTTLPTTTVKFWKWRSESRTCITGCDVFRVFDRVVNYTSVDYFVHLFNSLLYFVFVTHVHKGFQVYMFIVKLETRLLQ